MTEEDKEAVTDIITENVIPSTVNEISPYIEAGDTEGFMTYAEENLSEEDYEKIRELYKNIWKNNRLLKLPIRISA